jgi:predicted membrane-bound mannosyltransferase
MALPMLTLVIRWRQPERYTFGFDKHDPRATLSMVFLFPAALLAQRAWQDVHLVSWLPLALPALIGGALIVSVSGLEKKLSWHNLMCLLMISVYLAASAVFINITFDTLPAASTAVQVVDKTQEKGSKERRFLMLAVPGTAPATKFAVS